MMGYIQGQAGDAYAGKWDIAPVLPGGATNWGGSWLGVPTAAHNKDAAIALVQWLSNKDQQVTMWTDGRPLPVEPDAAAAPAVKTATSAYFSNAPVGTIFGDIAGEMKIPPIGLYDTQIQKAFTTQLTNVETKGTSPDDAYKPRSTRSSRSPADGLPGHRRLLRTSVARARRMSLIAFFRAVGLAPAAPPDER